jgi:hypothetical protein
MDQGCEPLDPQVFCAALAPLGINLDLVGDLLPLGQARKAGALDRADMNENVVPAVIRRYKSEALLTVEPFNRTGSHNCSLPLTCIAPYHSFSCAKTPQAKRNGVFYGQVAPGRVFGAALALSLERARQQTLDRIVDRHRAAQDAGNGKRDRHVDARGGREFDQYRGREGALG